MPRTAEAISEVAGRAPPAEIRPTGGDASVPPIDRPLVGVAVTDDRAVLYEHDGAARVRRELSSSRWVRCGSRDVAHSPAVTAIAEVEEHAGEGYGFILRPKLHKTVDDVRAAIASVTDLDLRIVDRAESHTTQILIDHGMRYGVGLHYADLRVLAVHMLVAQTNPAEHWASGEVAENVIIALSARDTEGHAFERSLLANDVLTAPDRTRAQREMIVAFAEFVRDTDPDVLVGYDLLEWVLPFLYYRTEGNLPLGRGSRAEQQVAVATGGLSAAGTWRKRFHVTVPGREVIDLGDVEAQGNRGRRTTLAQYAKTHGIRADPEDPAVAAHLIRNPQDETFTFALDGAGEQVAAVLDLAGRVVPAYLVVAGNVPVTLGEATRTGSGALVDLAMTAAYHRARRALPFREAKTSFGGPRAELLLAGRHERVCHADFESFYPSIMVSEGVSPKHDVLGAYLPMLTRLLEERLRAKRRATDSSLSDAERDEARATSAGLKLLVNAFWGALGSRSFHFNDMRAAGRVARIGEDILDRLVVGLEDEGLPVVQFQTDGVWIVAEEPADVEERIRAVAERAAGYPLVVGPAVSALFSSRDRQGVAFGRSGVGATRKGALLRGASLPPALLAAWNECLRLCVEANPAALDPIAEVTRALKTGTLPTSELAFVARTPTIGRPEEDADTFGGSDHNDPDLRRRAVASAVSHARASGRVVPEGAEVSWYVADVDSSEWWKRARLVGSADPVDASWYLTMLDRHLGALAETVGSTPLREALAGRSVEAPPLPPLRVGWLGGGATRLLHVGPKREEVRAADVAADIDASRLATVLGIKREVVSMLSEARLRVRTGDLRIVAHPTLSSTEVALVIERTTACLIGLGALPDDYVRTNFGDRPALVVASTVLDLPDLANLHDVHRKIVEELAGVLRRDESVKPLSRGNFFDLSLYASDAVVPAPWLASRPSPTPGARLRTLGETTRVTVGWRRIARLSPDETPRDRAAEARRARLFGAGVVMRAPCAEAIEKQLRDGRVVGNRALDKFVNESITGLGDDPDRVAAVLANAELTPAQQRRHLRVLNDGSARLLTKPRAVPCSGPGVAEVCQVSGCYLSGQVPTPQPPSLEKFRDESTRLIAAAMSRPVPRGRPLLLQASIRGGKTTAAVKRAVEEVSRGARVAYVVPTHAAGRVFMSYLAERRIAVLPPGKVAVHLYGRVPDACTQPRRSSCDGCPHGMYVSGASRRVLAPGVSKLRRRVGVFDLDKLRDQQESTGLCPRSASRALADRADVVVMTFAALGSPDTRKLLGEIDVVIVDEADQLPETAINAARERLPIAAARTTTKRTLRGRECGMGCASCQLDFVHRPGEKGEGLLAADESCATLDAHADPHGFVDALRRGVGILRAGTEPALADALDLNALERNIDALAAALGTSRADATRHLDPKTYLVDLGRRFLGDDRGDVSVVAADVGPDEPVPIWVRFVACMTQSPASRGACDDTEMLLRFAAFAHLAAMGAGGALVDARPRPGRYAYWQPSCELSLSFVDARAIRALSSWLLERRTIMLSGSFVEPDTTAALLGLASGGYDVVDATVPLHGNIDVLVHSVGSGSSDAPDAPQILGAEDIGDVLATAGALRRAHGANGPLRALIFTNSKATAERAAVTLAKQERFRVERVSDGSLRVLSGSAIEGRGGGAPIDVEVVVEHLRSPTSRGHDRDFDAVVVLGNGRPAFSEMNAVALSLQQSMGLVFSGTELAHESRLRAVTQAALRAAGLSTRSVVLIASDLLPADLPPYFAARARSTSTLFGVEPGDPVPRVEMQRAAIGMSIAELLRGGNVVCPQWWLSVAALHPLPRTLRQLARNVVAVKRVVRSLSRGGLLSPSAAEPRLRIGRELLVVLECWGVVKCVGCSYRVLSFVPLFADAGGLYLPPSLKRQPGRS